MSGKVIVGVSVDLDFPLLNLAENLGPLRKFRSPVNNYLIPILRPFLDSPAGAKPAHIREVCGNRVELLEPLRGPRHPCLIYERESDTARAQSLDKLRHKPILVTSLDTESVALW